MKRLASDFLEPNVYREYDYRQFMNLIPAESHLWSYVVRGNLLGLIKRGKGALAEDLELFEEWANVCCGTNAKFPSDLGPQHPLGKRIVTVHGDLHRGNIIRHKDDDQKTDNILNKSSSEENQSDGSSEKNPSVYNVDQFQCVDFEFTHAGCQSTIS